MQKRDVPLIFASVAIAFVVLGEFVAPWVTSISQTFAWPTAAGWAAIGTMVLAGFAIAQWHLSVRSARRQMRAYLTIGTRRAIFDNSSQVTCEALVKNCGQTPAYDVSYRMGVFAKPYPGPGLEACKGQESEIVIGPGEEKTVYFRKPLSKREQEQFHSGALAIWFIGEIKYKDAFQRHQFAQFKSLAWSQQLSDSSDVKMSIWWEDGNKQS